MAHPCYCGHGRNNQSTWVPKVFFFPSLSVLGSLHLALLLSIFLCITKLHLGITGCQTPPGPKAGTGFSCWHTWDFFHELGGRDLLRIADYEKTESFHSGLIWRKQPLVSWLRRICMARAFGCPCNLCMAQGGETFPRGGLFSWRVATGAKR